MGTHPASSGRQRTTIGPGCSESPPNRLATIGEDRGSACSLQATRMMPARIPASIRSTATPRTFSLRIAMPRSVEVTMDGVQYPMHHRGEEDARGHDEHQARVQGVSTGEYLPGG